MNFLKADSELGSHVKIKYIFNYVFLENTTMHSTLPSSGDTGAVSFYQFPYFNAPSPS